MKYTRQEIDAGALRDILPPGTKLVKQPELPKREFLYDGVKYKVTDLRLLHPAGAEALTIILNTMLNDSNTREVTMAVAQNADESIVPIVQDIVMGFSYEARGKRGWYVGGGIVDSCGSDELEDGSHTIRFGVSADRVAAVQSLAKKGGKLGLLDLVVAIVEWERSRWGGEVLSAQETAEK